MYLSSITAANSAHTAQTGASAVPGNSGSAADGFRRSLTAQKSVVDDFKAKNPGHARHVDRQVRAGLNYLEKNGLSADMTAAMTMDEYQAYIYALIDQIPYDSSRPNDTSVVSISDKGWEQMRKDPKYEAWIIGYLVEDRSVRNPFYSWGDDGGSISSEHFGASIEEHHGEGFHKPTTPKNDRDGSDKEEDWWIKRHRHIKKLIREQAEKSMKEDAAQRTRFWKEYAFHQYEDAQGLPRHADSPLPPSIPLSESTVETDGKTTDS